jgi:hypothetical protein
MHGKNMPQIMNAQPSSPGAPLGLQSTAPEQGAEPHERIGGIVGLAIFTFKERGLRREPETGTPSAMKPVLEFEGEITTERHQTNASFARTDAKECSDEIDINQAQSECLTDPQSGAIQYQK